MKLRLLGLVMIASFGYLRGETGLASLEKKPEQKMTPLNSYFLKGAELAMETSFVSQHMWRGFASGNAPAIEPYVALRYRNLSLNAWAAYAVDDSYREFDLFVTYTWKNFTIGLFDYYCPDNETENNQFLNYRSKETRHLIEWQIQYDGNEKFPIQVLFGQFVHGFDMNENQKQNYSMYLEMGYSWIFKGAKIKFEIGMSPVAGMYAQKASVFNYGLSLEKPLRLTQTFSIPVKYKLIYNKETNDMHFSISLKLK